MKTAIVIPVAEAEQIVGDERRLYDPSCALGMPAHITLVTPFAPPPISPEMVSELKRIVGAFSATNLRFEDIERFANTVYLKPEPGEFIIRLTEAIVSRWPQWMPYGGTHAHIVPHLTVADRIEDQRLLDNIAGLVRERLPIEARVHEAWLMETSADDIWRRRTPLPFENPQPPIIRSSRLRLSEFAMADAADVYNCITPAITAFMFWEPPSSFEEYKARREQTLLSANRNDFSFVVRRLDTRECLGIASLDGIDADAPELGLWLKETAHGNRYGTEIVRAVADWAARTLGKERFTYAVATENIPSRRIAESMGGQIVGTRTGQKYDSVVYHIAWPPQVRETGRHR